MRNMTMVMTKMQMRNMTMIMTTLMMMMTKAIDDGWMMDGRCCRPGLRHRHSAAVIPAVPPPSPYLLLLPLFFKLKVNLFPV